MSRQKISVIALGYAQDNFEKMMVHWSNVGGRLGQKIQPIGWVYGWVNRNLGEERKKSKLV